MANGVAVELDEDGVGGGSLDGSSHSEGGRKLHIGRRDITMDIQRERET